MLLIKIPDIFINPPKQTQFFFSHTSPQKSHIVSICMLFLCQHTVYAHAIKQVKSNKNMQVTSLFSLVYVIKYEEVMIFKTISPEVLEK